MQSLRHQEPVPPTEPTPATTSRLRTVTGNRFPRKCACGCGFQIPRDPEVRYVVDFGGPRPYPAYLREHSPDYGTYGGKPRARENAEQVPGFVPASEFPRPPSPTRPPAAPRPVITSGAAQDEAEPSPSPEAGRGWAFSQLVFNPGSFESVRAGFASYAREGETERDLRGRVHSTVLADVEQQVMALRALHAKLHQVDGRPSFAELAARSRPR